MTTDDSLWSSGSATRWRSALDRYETVIAEQGVAPLVGLDAWYRDELPARIASRERPHVTLDELARLTQWKMARGVWRARNLELVRGNDAARVVETSGAALARVPHPTGPISDLAQLDGVGPATASAVAAAFAPALYPFFDEIVAAQIPDLGRVAWTLGYYARYAEALRERATALGATWTPVMAERALWSSTGGKAGLRRGAERAV